MNNQTFSSSYNENSYGGNNFSIGDGLKVTNDIVNNLNDDSHKKLNKLQKEYDSLVK